MKHFFASALLVAALAPAARAGGAVKAHLVCTPDGGKPLASGAKNALDKDITCAIAIDKGDLASSALVTITASLVSPIGRVGGPTRTTSAAGGEHGGQQLSYVASEPFHHGGDFMPCAAVELGGTIVDGGKTLWKGAITIAPTCAPPKLDAKLGGVNCSGEGKGPSVDYPGEGDKGKTELSSLTCTVNLLGAAPDAKIAAIAVRGSAAAVRPLTTQPGTTSGPQFAFVQLVGGAIPHCKSFTIDAAILRGDGATLWKGSLPIAQRCAAPAKTK